MGEGREERKGYWLNKVRENHNQYPLNEIHMHISILKTLISPSVKGVVLTQYFPNLINHEKFSPLFNI